MHLTARMVLSPLGLAVAGVAAFGSFMVLAPAMTDWVQLVNNLVQLLVPLAVTAPLAWRAAQRTSGRARTAWLLLAAAALSWGGGQVLWTWSESVRHEALPYPSPADVGYLGAVPLLLAGILFHPARHLRAIGRTRAFLDGSILATSLLFIFFATFLEEAQSESDGSVLSWVLAVIYPVSDVLAAGVVVAVLMRRAGRWSGPLPLIGAGVVALGLADTAFAVATTNGTYGGLSVTDVGWPLGFLLIGLASVGDRGATEPEVGEDIGTSLVPIVIPYLPMVPALAVLIGRAASGLAITPLMAIVGSTGVLLVVVRSIVTLLENRQLTDNMGRALHTLRQREEELEHRALHDALTGLANRALLRDRLEHALAGRGAAPVGLLFIDLDDFKTVNDSLGHDAGDRLLELVAERLRACVRPGDTVARFGGDEFAILLGPTRDDLGTADLLAPRVLAAFESSFRLGGRDLEVGASVGVVSASLPGATAAEVLQDADLAMYAAKAAGKGRCARFEPVIRRQAVDRLELVADLRGAAPNGELVLHFQPIVDLASFEVIGQEALIRWKHPRRGLLPPLDFIPLAEETGAIDVIGAWALERACAAAVAWAGGASTANIGVNVSALQLADPTFVAIVAGALDRSGLDPQRLELEITESILLTDEQLAGRLRQLRRIGVRLAIDDFGTGYSSLSYLARLPVDVVKVDRSFVEGLGSGGDIEVLVRSVVQLALALGMRAVGEGIETEAQLTSLREMGCAAGQGYLLGRPQSQARLHLDRGAATPTQSVGARPGATAGCPG